VENAACTGVMRNVYKILGNVRRNLGIEWRIILKWI
jgi:hypothetical protein